MNPKDFLAFKQAADHLQCENDTPEKARAFLIRLGYLDASGEVAYKFRND